jgi:4-hydroxy-4-methyl-2-oxoglutarate aldolase
MHDGFILIQGGINAMTNTDIDIKAFSQVPSAYVTDAMRRLGLITGWTAGVYSISKKRPHMFGRAVTLNYAPKKGLGAKLPGQFQIVKDCNPGAVLVFAARGSSCWVTGGNVANVAINQKLGGIAVDGCLRDIDEMAEADLPVFCRGAGVRPYANELELIAINVPVEFAGTQIYPGDILVGDGDGIVVVPADRIKEVLFQLGDIPQLEKELELAILRQASVSELNEIAMRKSQPRRK